MCFENELTVVHCFPNEWDNKIMTHEWPNFCTLLFSSHGQWIKTIVIKRIRTGGDGGEAQNWPLGGG